ncbi:MAG: hypothetical protein P8Q99_03565 [Paracoccaceae bacterium]|nr:hypothetical protein [Paracoccaceae bacterium]
MTDNKRFTLWQFLLAILVTGVIVGFGVKYFNSHMSGHNYEHHKGSGHHMGGDSFADHHGADGTGHDEVNMPGLKGKNASAEESAELAVMFRNFETITREVTELPNGIRTITRSSDDQVMAVLVSHVAGMIDRIERSDDPEIIIQSKTLDILFARGDKIQNDIQVTDEGIVVTQTSDDPEVAKALQIHAGEVSAMADHGMQAVHEMMMKSGDH